MEAWLISEGRGTLQGRIQAGTAVIIVKKECTTLLGQGRVLVKTWGEWDKLRWRRGGGGDLKRVPKPPARDDQSVHQRGLTGARWNSSAGRTKKHPPWESAFSPARRGVMDWAGQCTQCICEERRKQRVCQKNTSTLLLECTEIFNTSIFISLFHTSDVRMDTHTDGKHMNKRFKVTHTSLSAEEMPRWIFQHGHTVMFHGKIWY